MSQTKITDAVRDVTAVDGTKINAVDAAKITTGTVDNARISLDAAEIPDLAASKITTGTVDVARLPSTVLNSNVPATDTSILEMNVAILAFKIAAADSLSKFNMVDQVIDDYKDTTGIDTSNSVADNLTSGYYSGVELGHTINWVGFTGSQYYTHAANIGNGTDLTGIISVWMQRASNSSQYKTFGSQGSFTAGTWETSGEHRFRATYSNGSYNSVRAYTASTHPTGLDTTYHLLLAWNTGTGVVTQHINDVSSISSAISTGVAPDFDSSNFSIGSWADPGYAFFHNGKIADFYLTLGETLDMTVEANRRKFIDASGNPVSLGADGSTPTGSQPEVYLGGTTKDYTNWEENLGSASNFVKTGTPTDGGTLGASSTYADMTLISTQTTSTEGSGAATPTSADIVILIEDGAGTATVNTHVKAYVGQSVNTTPVYTSEVTLVDEGTWGTSKRIFAARNIDTSALSGTKMNYKITTHSQAIGLQTRIHATSLAWS